MMQWRDLLCEEKKVMESREQPTSNDTRSIFEKDYHRIVSSSAFRRMQDKAQVFPLEKYDFVRTRLTHSIEVASIAKSIGKGLVDNFLNKKESCEQIEYIPVILDCAGLLHDIGNPPFGHFGEQAIQNWFNINFENIVYNRKSGTFSWRQKKTDKSISHILNVQQKNDFLLFEGNAQVLRDATKLAYVVDENGMNLSYPLLNTIIKYPVNSTKKDEEYIVSKKIGYFYSENEIYNEIVTSTKTKKGKAIYRHPLTFLLEAADDIVYHTSDIEDAIKKKKLSIHDIELLLCNDNYNINNEKFDFFNDVFCKDVREQINIYREKSKEQKYKNEDLYIIQRLKIFIQGHLISAVVKAFEDNYKQIMDGIFNDELLNMPSTYCIIKLLKQLKNDYVFNSEEVLKNEVRGHKNN